MKILLTGANGLLGQKIIDRAPRLGAELVATAKGPYRGPSRSGFVYRELDITDKQAVKKVILEEKPDAVIHAAAMTNVDACETRKEEAWKVNAEATGYIAGACDEAGSHLIHVSTDFIFRGDAGPYDESGRPDPLSYYGETKLEAERLVMKMRSPHTIIRTVLVYGVTPGMSRSNIVLWAREALLSGKKINVVTDQFRSPTLAEDLAEACLSAALKKATGIYHVSGPDQMSIFELVHRVAKFFGLDGSLISPSTSENLDQPARRPPVTGFIIDKARRELDYRPHGFEEGLAVVKAQLE